MKHLAIATALIAAPFATALHAGETPSPEGAEVYFIGLEDGAVVQNPVTLRFGLKGMGIAPAGYEVDDTGHHHLLINMSYDDLDPNESMPATDTLLHFGGGQSEMTRELPPGEHTIQLVLGDFAHVPHDPPVVSEVITITVE